MDTQVIPEDIFYICPRLVITSNSLNDKNLSQDIDKSLKYFKDFETLIIMHTLHFWPFV
jgi:hypothetical protein